MGVLSSHPPTIADLLHRCTRAAGPLIHTTGLSLAVPCLWAASLILIASDTSADPIPGQAGQATSRAIVRLSDLPQNEPTQPPAIAPYPESRPRMDPDQPVPSGPAVVKPDPGSGARERTITRGPASPPPAASFRALEDDNTRIPPDTHGAVGPNHLMVTLNSQVRVQGRSGVPLHTVALRSFWANVGPFSTAIGVFDPRVVYDPYGQRWVTVAVADPKTASSSLLVGVSSTTDPTGLWTLWRVDADPIDLLSADYPSVGFNRSWIAVQVNILSNETGGLVRSDVFAFDKSDLYAGGPGRHTRFLDASGFTTVPALTYSPDLAELYLLETWNGNFVGSGFLRLSQISGSVGTEVMTAGLAFPSSPVPWDFAPPDFADFAPQRGSSDKIQVNDDRIMNVLYRNGSLWCAHTVFYPATGGPTRCSAQWWEITPGGVVVQRGVIDDPAGRSFYAFPTIAANQASDALVGYSLFSSSRYASAGYSFRAASDLPGTMRPGVVLKEGEAPYFKTFGGAFNRWGDYSHTVVDPTDDTALWTIQEYAATPVSGSDRWGTWWGKIVPTRGVPGIGAPGWVALALLLGASAVLTRRTRGDRRK